ncbi:metallophosphoesterase [Deinococcus sp. KSM4-11]|uniref:metallophosphoesterase n=1 Tax=Deinococcus sp. KSM4-11 TaxID=2568654 RepID=UPI0010A2C720|nr:metallophosphoesterase [Deinococcus sp. KSM4-11]THF86031.1 metallophosphoesterase [Deinococcus sp. KSM4-11]
MHKFLAFGDVHADFDTLWAALRAASCADGSLQPTPPVLAGLFQVILIGDLVHPKNEREYARLAGVARFDPKDPDHLFLAAREQVKQLEVLKAYQEAAPHAVHIILGNHDDAVLNATYVLGTSGGIVHNEFDPEHGGLMLPDHLRLWMQTFPREIRVGNLQFAHVSPLPAHSHYDDLFYADHSPKRWFHETPEYVDMAGLSFGVYGHTQIDDGILIDEEHRLAMIDALHAREYLELLVEPSVDLPLQSVRAVPF